MGKGCRERRREISRCARNDGRGEPLHKSKKRLGEVDFGFGFDDEEGVGVGAAGGVEFLAGFVEGGSEDSENDFALGAADEVEAALLLDEL